MILIGDPSLRICVTHCHLWILDLPTHPLVSSDFSCFGKESFSYSGGWCTNYNIALSIGAHQKGTPSAGTWMHLNQKELSLLWHELCNASELMRLRALVTMETFPFYLKASILMDEVKKCASVLQCFYSPTMFSFFKRKPNQNILFAFF